MASIYLDLDGLGIIMIYERQLTRLKIETAFKGGRYRVLNEGKKGKYHTISTCPWISGG